MPKIKIYTDEYPFDQGEDSGTYWEDECVKHLNQGCVCWKCEEDHDDTSQWKDDWDGREYFEKEYEDEH
ncbi:hypothetical protein VPHK406_0237 [Vibrio phage K406]